MTDAFLLWHCRPLGDGNTADKLIGVYSSRAQAQAAQTRKCAFPGFRDDPALFQIDRYVLDQDAWSEGFGPDDRSS